MTTTDQAKGKLPIPAMFKLNDPPGAAAPVALLESGLSDGAVRAYVWLYYRARMVPYVLPLADMAEALGWSVQRAHDQFLELRRAGVMVKRDEDGAWVLLGEKAPSWRAAPE